MGNHEKELIKKCKKLAYSQRPLISDDTIFSTNSELIKLFEEYGFASILSALANLWDLETAIPFFENIELPPKNPIKIQTIATYYPKTYGGGIARVQAKLMNLWDSMGYKVLLIAEEPENPLDFQYPPSTKRFIIPNTTDIYSRLSRLQDILINEKVDLYINNLWASPIILWELLLLRYLDISCVQYIHSDFAFPFSWGKYMLYYPQVFKLCDLVLCLSESSARFYQLCGCNSYLIENPIPDDLLNITYIESPKTAPHHILMIGRLSPEKRPMDALYIFKKVHDAVPTVVLDIIGHDDCGFLNQIRAFCNENGLKNAVIYHGMLSQKEIENYYLKASALLFTSMTEGYPMVLLESKAYGLPVVMYELPYLTLTNDSMGILTSPLGNIAMMAEHILHILSDDEYRKSLCKTSRNSFETFAKYDLKTAWINVISICEKKDNGRSIPTFFPSESLSYCDRFIMPRLLDMVKLCFEHSETSHNTSLNTRVGKIVLFFPRLLRASIAKMVNIFKKY